MQTQSTLRGQRLKFVALPVLRLYFCKTHFSPLSPSPRVPLGLICIISLQSTARCDGITLRDGWIRSKAAVRTKYQANVLSRRRGSQSQYRKRGWGGTWKKTPEKVFLFFQTVKSEEEESVGDTDALIQVDNFRTGSLFLLPPSLPSTFCSSALSGPNDRDTAAR